MLKRLSALGFPALVTIGLAAAAIVWTLGYRAKREAYYNDFIYRRLADTALAMLDRLQAIDKNLSAHLQDLTKLRELSKEKRRVELKKITGKVQGVSVAPLSSQDNSPLYIYLPTQEKAEAEVYTTFDLLAAQPSDPIFDDLLVSDQDGRVLYQQSWDAQRWDNVKFLLPKSETEKQDNPALSEVLLSRAASPLEKKFRVFRQGVRLTGSYPLSGSLIDKKAAPILEVYLIGLVKQERLDSEVLALPFTVSLLFVFAGLAVFSSIPMIRLCLLCSLQRLKRRDGIWLTASTFITASLVAFGLLTFTFFRLALGDEVDQTLETLADRIEESVTKEFAAIVDTLGQFTADQCKQECVEGQRVHSLAAKWRKQESPRFYQHLDTFFWTDSAGNQKAKFALAPFPGREGPPLVDVADRSYFKAIIGQRAWTDVNPKNARPQVHFYVESVVSRTTGENVAILATPFAEAFDSADSKKDKFNVAGVQVRPASLFHTFLPPSYGFAIIDPNSDPPGKVLFHNQDDRNLREWMFDDLLGTAPLRSVIFGRGRQIFSSAYLGRDHRLLARPFKSYAGSPWILVVFSDKEYFRSALADVMRFALLLYAIYVVVVFSVLAFLLGRAVFRESPDAGALNPLLWLWPNEEHHSGYYGLIVAFSIGLVIYLACLFTLSPLWLLLPVFQLPLMTLAFGRRLRPWGLAKLSHSKLKALSPNARYTIAATLLIQLVAVMPCTAVYRIAYDSKMGELARHELLRLEKHLRERDVEDRETADKYFADDRAEANAFTKEMASKPETGLYSLKITRLAANCEREQKGFADTLLKKGLGGLYDQAGIETVATENTEDPQFHWCDPADGAERLNAADLRGAPSLQIALPALSMYALTGPWALVIGLLVPSAIWAWMFTVSKRLFYFDAVPVLPDASTITGHNLLLTNVGTPRKLDWGDCKTIDLAKEPYTWSSEMGNPEGQSFVVLQRLETKIDDPVGLERVARLILEWKDKVRFVVCSSVDPLLHLELNGQSGDKQPTSSHLLPLLSRAFGGFAWVAAPRGQTAFKIEMAQAATVGHISPSVTSVSGSPALSEPSVTPSAAAEPVTSCTTEAASEDRLIASECEAEAWLREEFLASNLGAYRSGTAEDALDFIRRRADSHYRELWKACTTPERVILVQLAEEGVVNLHNRDGLVELIRKGLVRMPATDQSPRLMNRSFRRFVLGAKSGLPLEDLEHSTEGGWDTLRHFVWPTLLILGLYILITQRKYFDNIVPIVSGVAGEITAFLKTFNNFQRLWSGSRSAD